jgi:peroxidase
MPSPAVRKLTWRHNFSAGANDPPVGGPNPRLISNVVAGGTGANGQNAGTTDPVASAWLYVFGQFVDHDLDLESTPTTTPAINITVPPNDPVFKAGTTIAMTRDIRNPATDTIINTFAGYLRSLATIRFDRGGCRFPA